MNSPRWTAIGLDACTPVPIRSCDLAPRRKLLWRHACINTDHVDARAERTAVSSAGVKSKASRGERNVQTDRERVIGRLDDVVHCDVGPGEGAKDGGADPRRIRGRFELGQGDPLAPGEGSKGRRGPESADLARG